MELEDDISTIDTYDSNNQNQKDANKISELNQIIKDLTIALYLKSYNDNETDNNQLINEEISSDLITSSKKYAKELVISFTFTFNLKIFIIN